MKEKIAVAIVIGATLYLEWLIGGWTFDTLYSYFCILMSQEVSLESGLYAFFIKIPLLLIFGTFMFLIMAAIVAIATCLVSIIL